MTFGPLRESGGVSRTGRDRDRPHGALARAMAKWLDKDMQQADLRPE
ncbi:hypothetical protein HSR121_1011 [Halapricum desulfuricans]|uniref:Uncharacterized protein n=1 Tax=Halapricum desulfuricans TaxID=2841257 RepID=A0A897MZD7_9EURY|nr:hypothetical protein HSR121_1011 [Halapricum desulfuricans]